MLTSVESKQHAQMGRHRGRRTWAEAGGGQLEALKEIGTCGAKSLGGVGGFHIFSLMRH